MGLTCDFTLTWDRDSRSELNVFSKDLRCGFSPSSSCWGWWVKESKCGKRAAVPTALWLVENEGGSLHEFPHLQWGHTCEVTPGMSHCDVTSYWNIPPDSKQCFFFFNIKNRSRSVSRWSDESDVGHYHLQPGNTRPLSGEQEVEPGRTSVFLKDAWLSYLSLPAFLIDNEAQSEDPWLVLREHTCSIVSWCAERRTSPADLALDAELKKWRLVKRNGAGGF